MCVRKQMLRVELEQGSALLENLCIWKVLDFTKDTLTRSSHGNVMEILFSHLYVDNSESFVGC